jgi:hypothetical protein
MRFTRMFSFCCTKIEKTKTESWFLLKIQLFVFKIAVFPHHFENTAPGNDPAVTVTAK